MGCAESVDIQESNNPPQRRSTVDIKPTVSHIVTKPQEVPKIQNPSSGVKTETVQASAVFPVFHKEGVENKEDRDFLFAQALQAYNKSQYKKAINICEGILNKDSNDHQTYDLLCKVQYWNTNYSKGIQSGLKAVSLQPSNDSYWFHLGQNYYYAQNYSQTIKAYKKAVEINPKSTDHLYHLGRAYYYKQQYKQAIESYRAAAKIKEHQDYFFEIGQCYYWLEDYDNSISNLEKALKLNPKHHRSMNNIGLANYQQGNYENAQVWYKKGLQLSPKNKSYLWNLGRNYYWKQEYEKAILAYQSCKEIDIHYQYDLQIAWCYFYLLDYESAHLYINKSIEIDDKKAITYYKKGYVCYYQERYQESLKWYHKSLELDSQSYNTLLGIANSYYYMQKYPSAIQSYSKCLDSGRNLSQIQERIAKSYYYNQQYQQAIQHFDKCLQLRPKDIQPLILKGRCFFNLGDYQKSYDQFKNAHALAQSIKTQNSQNYHFYITVINQQLKAAEDFQIKAKIGIITKQDQTQIEKMRQNFEKKIQKLFCFQVKQFFDKKTAKDKPKISINNQIIQIAKNLFINEQLYCFDSEERLNNICEKIKNLFKKDYGYFQIFAYIFDMFVWINKFKMKKSIQAIEDQLGKKIRYLSNKNPPTSQEVQVDKSIQFPSYPEVKYNLFLKKEYFQSYFSLVKEIQLINQDAKKDLAPFKQLLYEVQKQSNGYHAKVGMKLPLKQQSKDQTDYQQKIFKVLLRIFEKMFKQLKAKKSEMLEQIQQDINSSNSIPIQKIILIMMNKWISYINKVLKDRKNLGIPTQCCISDLVRGKCMFKNINNIQKAVDYVIKICQQKKYQIMELDNRIQKSTQDVTLKIKIQHCVCELQLALQFDPTMFEFGHSFYQIQRCSLGYIFGCSLLLTKDVNETFPQLLFQNKKITKKLKQIDQNVYPALKFVLKQLMESVKD